MKKLFGILTFLATLALMTNGIMLLGQGVLFKSSLLILGFVNFAVVIAMCGIYLVNTFCEPSKLAKYSIWGMGVFLVLFTALVAFEVLDPRTNWSIVIGVAIIFITLVQLQLLKWENSRSILKILGLIMLLSNVFLAFYFIAQLSMEALGIVVDITVISSTFSFIIGLIFSREKRKDTAPVEAS